MAHNDLILNKTLMNVVRSLPDKERHEIYDAVMDYALTGEVRELSPEVTVAFTFIRQDLDNKKCKKKRGNPNFQEGKTNPYYSGIKDNSDIIMDNSEIIQDNSDNNYPNYPDSDSGKPAKIAATDNSGAIQDNSDNNYPIIPASCARGESLSVSIDNLDINNKFLNINIPESDRKLISSENNSDSDNDFDKDKLKSLEENREYSPQVIEHKQEDKLKNKRDNTTHVREKNAAAPEIEPAKPPDKKKKSGDERFKVPAVEEVAAYCAERRNNVDAQAWWDFYQSKGWMVGKNKMKDWKAAVRTWEKRDTDTGRKWKRGSTILEAVSAVARSIEEDKKNKGKRIDFDKLLNG